MRVPTWLNPCLDGHCYPVPMLTDLSPTALIGDQNERSRDNSSGWKKCHARGRVRGRDRKDDQVCPMHGAKTCCWHEVRTKKRRVLSLLFDNYTQEGSHLHVHRLPEICNTFAMSKDQGLCLYVWSIYGAECNQEFSFRSNECEKMTVVLVRSRKIR